jgi:hypothetical protein
MRLGDGRVGSVRLDQCECVQGRDDAAGYDENCRYSFTHTCVRWGYQKTASS